MLTRLKVSGFKNLVDVDVHFGPFTCIVGDPNAGAYSTVHQFHVDRGANPSDNSDDTWTESGITWSNKPAMCAASSIASVKIMTTKSVSKPR